MLERATARVSRDIAELEPRKLLTKMELIVAKALLDKAWRQICRKDDLEVKQNDLHVKLSGRRTNGHCKEA
jgi:hypothetical protein